MLVVKVELWPFGDKRKAKEIGRTYIANVGGTLEKGDYIVGVCRRGSTKLPIPINPEGPKSIRQGSVTNYPRRSYNVWRLVIRALLACFAEER